MTNGNHKRHHTLLRNGAKSNEILEVLTSACAMHTAEKVAY